MQITANTITRALERAARCRIDALRFRWYLYQLERQRPERPAIILGPGDDPDAAAAELQRTGAAAVTDLDGNALMV